MELQDFKQTMDFNSPARRPHTKDLIAESREAQSIEDMDRLHPTQWALVKAATYAAVPPSLTKLPSGFYNIDYIQEQPVFIKKDVKVDDLMRFTNSIPDKVIEEIKTFWSRGEIFKKYGFLHRRGYMLYGPAGGGKTAMVQQIISDIIIDDGIVFMCDEPGVFILGLDKFRQVEPRRNIVCVFEDIDSTIDKYGEDGILALLDGENQVDCVLNIATTNYPEKLNRRLVARPRRFDRIIKINNPTKEMREKYFAHKLGIKDQELKEWVKHSEGFSFASMAELVISVICLGNTFEHSADILKEMSRAKVSSKEDEGPIGFGL
jgi:SpoVK/Ycf46/Vps4 family AAA+-type ATPase